MSVTVSIVIDKADTRFFANIFVKTKKFAKAVLACSYGAQVESFKPKNGQISRDTVTLSESMNFSESTTPYMEILFIFGPGEQV